jgi:hypothetical protein
MHETAQIENTTFSKKVRRMLGLSLETWNNIMVMFLGIGAFAAVMVGVSTFAVIRLQKLEATNAALAFEQYKLGVDSRVADAKKEGIEAGKTAGDAVLRAKELEKEVANAKTTQQKVEIDLSRQKERTAKAEKDLLELQERVKLRHLTKEQKDTLVRLLSNQLPISPVFFGDSEFQTGKCSERILSRSLTD